MQPRAADEPSAVTKRSTWTLFNAGPLSAWNVASVSKELDTKHNDFIYTESPQVTVRIWNMTTMILHALFCVYLGILH